MKHPPDSLAAKAADGARRAQEVTDTTAAALAAEQSRLAELRSRPLPAFDETEAQAALAKAEAADRVHGTATAVGLARETDARRSAFASAKAERDAEEAALLRLIGTHEITLAGCRAVLGEAIENERAAVSRAAAQRLPEVRKVYREALLAAMDLATDLFAVQALAVDVQRPLSRAISTEATALTFPALHAFGEEHLADLRGVGGQLQADVIVVGRHDAAQQALADVARIRAELTTKDAA